MSSETLSMELISSSRDHKQDNNSSYSLESIIYKHSLNEYNKLLREERDANVNWSLIFLDSISNMTELELVDTLEFKLTNRNFVLNISKNKDRSFFNNESALLKKYSKLENYKYPYLTKSAKDLQKIIFSEISNKPTGVVDSYTKRNLQNFMDEFSSREELNELTLEKMGFESYMSLLFSELDNKIIIYAIKPFNEHYIDDKVKDIDKVFDITVGFFDNKKQNFNYELLSGYFNSYSQFIYKNQLDSNIHGSIGEAAEIARYWYTEGVRTINANQSKYDEATNSFPFSEDFIKEILAADIDGVNNIEVYPFDRCFIFEHSALENNQMDIEEVVDIVVTEATLLQKSLNDQSEIKKRNNYLYEWDRYIQETEDYDIDFSKKNIENNSFIIESSDNTYKTLGYTNSATSKNKNNIEYDYKKDATFNDFKHDDAKAVNFMLNNLIHQNADNKDILYLEKKYFSNNDGLCYIYLNGINQEHIPLLRELQKAYWHNTLNKHQEDNILIQELRDNYLKFIDQVDLSNTKVIFISYDPSKVNYTNNDIEIDKKNALSMVIVANWDVPKTISEIISEKEDLLTALKLIVRQKTEANALISQEREKQSKFVLNLLRQAIHGIKGKVQDQAIKDEIDSVYRNFAQNIKDNKIELTSQEIQGENSKDRIYNLLFSEANLLSKFHEDPIGSSMHKISTSLQNNLYESIRLNDTVEFTLQESFIPNFLIKTDSLVIQEALHVMLKNAIEATQNYKGSNKKIYLLLTVTYSDSNKAILNFQIVNPTNGLSKERINEMNTATDDMSVDSSKDNSTGVGVASSRVQLESRFGKDAKIKFLLMTNTRIQSILSLPITLIDTNLYVDEIIDDTDEIQNYDVLYFEDSAQYYEASCLFLNTLGTNYKHFESMQESLSHLATAKLLFLDMNIFPNKESLDVELLGSKIIDKYKSLNPKGIVIVVSDAPDIQYQSIQEIDTLEPAQVYNGNSKSIQYIYETTKSLSDYLQPSVKINKYEKEESENLNFIVISALNEIKSSNNNIYLYNDVIRNIKELETLKNQWESIKFLDKYDMQSSISDTDSFYSTLIIQTDEIINKENFPFMIHLALKNNMLIVPSAIDLNSLEDIVRHRHTMYIYPNGILNGLKHDLNKLHEPEAILIKKIIEDNHIYKNALRATTFEDTLAMQSSVEMLESLKLMQRTLNTLLSKHKDNDEYRSVMRKYPSLEYFLQLLDYVGGIS